jgi:DNA-binding Lrp family transcriptional regulator
LPTERKARTRGRSTGLEARLVEAVTKHGPKNISLLSRVTGAHPETVRYKVKRQFRKFGFKIYSEPDLARIGLTRYLADLRLSPKYSSSAGSVMKALGEAAYLTYYARVVPQGHYSCVFELPPDSGEDHYTFLEHLQKSGVLKSFTLQRVKVSRRRSINPQHFNFRSGRWAIDWQRLRSEQPRQLAEQQAHQTPQADMYDLMLVAEFQRNPMAHVVRVAKQLSVHQKTLEYHFRAHVQRLKLIPEFTVRWFPEVEKPAKATHPAIVSLTFRDLSQDFRAVQQAVSKLPYLWTEDLLQDGTYAVKATMPAADTAPALSFVGEAAPDLYGRVDVGFVRRGEEAILPIPSWLYKEGWHYDLDAVKSGFSKSLKAGGS